MAFVNLTISELKRNFDLYDRDGSGKIQIEEIRALYASQGIHLGDGALRYLMNTYDKNKDGSIDFPEFVEFLTGKPITAEQQSQYASLGVRQQTGSANGSVSAFHRGYLDGYSKGYLEAVAKTVKPTSA